MPQQTAPSAPAGGAASFWRVAGRGRCPRCGEGRLFAGLLAIVPRCAACGLDLSAQDSGDAPAVLGIFVLGALTMIGAFLVEFRLQPPLWVHAVLWPALLIPASILTMRFAKAALVALTWRQRGRA
ncbi:DUF983 domain-containing protein [Falsiroseomonas tokyonensis]|uniref:DUF983 domain-containing protein n=1 Tax=Falsiroseomonas tokyonensis TaxID=430521 RepID=A0ABV7BTL3_9PROT|nr:DUF983 domain-containing protein [Falsiroseomonas tokyonensis]MBU8538921.1 DUF983 domain-containing protein [Falsiroseomonas tokyonensis]